MDETRPGIDFPLLMRRDLLRHHWDDYGIRAQLRSGEWTRIRQGAYVETVGWRALDAADQHLVLVRAVVRQSCTDLVVSHSSAAIVHGAPVWGLDLTAVHLTRRDRKAGRKEAGVRQHRGRLDDDDVADHNGVEVVSPTRAALELTTLVTPEVALVVINHLLHSGATTLEALRDRYERGMERWPSTLTTDIILRRATAACESVGESRMWHLFLAHGLPLPVPQYVVCDPSGAMSFRLDFAWPELGVFVEFDGKTKYTQPWRVGESAADVVFREKRREDRIRELTGWLCVRLTWADLASPDELVARIRTALCQGAKLTGVS